MNLCGVYGGPGKPALSLSQEKSMLPPRGWTFHDERTAQ
jgi:hypothetical protein